MWHLIALALPLLLSQQAPGDSVNPWAQLGIASIVCALLFWIAWTLWRDNKTKDDRIQLLQEERVQRERELADRVVPLLQQAAELLSRAPERFDRALQDAQNASRQEQVDGLIRRMEQTLRRIQPDES